MKNLKTIISGLIILKRISTQEKAQQSAKDGVVFLEDNAFSREGGQSLVN